MTRECICFAYFVEGVFVGWYGDTFGSVSTVPKIYTNTPEMIRRIQDNFQHKIKLLMREGDLKGFRALYSQGKEKLKGKIELKAVMCPVYDGPNPDFDKEDYERRLNEQNAHMQSVGVFDKQGIDRIDATDQYYISNPKVRPDNWIYADYEQIKQFAQTTPTSFIWQTEDVL